jgi:hypothetical protein
LVQRRNDSTTAKTAKPGEKPKEQPKTEKKTKNRENQKETELKGSENFSKPGKNQDSRRLQTPVLPATQMGCSPTGFPRGRCPLLHAMSVQ